MKTYYFDCQCYDFSHLIRLTLEDDGEIYIDIKLNHFLSFYKRLIIALKYIFAFDISNGHYYDTVMLKEEDYNLIKDIFDQSLKLKYK